MIEKTCRNKVGLLKTKRVETMLLDLKLPVGFKMNLEIGERGEVIASEPRLNVYGVGETVEEALEEFSSMLLDLYQELEQSEAVLSTPLQHQLTCARTITWSKD